MIFSRRLPEYLDGLGLEEETCSMILRHSNLLEYQGGIFE
jgi:hypothetical protein